MLGERLYTPNEAAKLLSVSRSMIYVLIDRGDLEVTKIGPRSTRISESELKAFLASRVQRVTRETPSTKRPAAATASV